MDEETARQLESVKTALQMLARMMLTAKAEFEALRSVLQKRGVLPREEFERALEAWLRDVQPLMQKFEPTADQSLEDFLRAFAGTIQ